MYISDPAHGGARGTQQAGDEGERTCSKGAGKAAILPKENLKETGRVARGARPAPRGCEGQNMRKQSPADCGARLGLLHELSVGAGTLKAAMTESVH